MFESGDALAHQVAAIIASVIRERNALGQNAVLGLPTGSTPVGVYRELIRLHREEGLDFSNVVTFNLDEYYGLEPDRLQSYHRWMRVQLFDHINIPADNIHIPDGTVNVRPNRTVLPPVRSRHRGGGRDRRDAIGDRTERSCRIQRTVQHSPQQNAALYAGPGHTDGCCR